MKNNLQKIYNLKNALDNIGIETELNLNTEWYCTDNHIHYGIELYTNMDYGEDCWSFIFTPDGKYITSCLDAPIKENVMQNDH